MADDAYADDGIWDTFATAIVTITLGDHTPLVVGDRPLPWPEPTHILTAWNPGEQRPDAENRAANLRLARRIDELGANRLDAVGSSPDGSWSEDGFAVVGLDLEEALDLAREFGQMAIYEAIGTTMVVVSCDPGAPRTGPAAPTPR